jgi:hypothetical protein
VSAYFELLKDPRWQKRRLEILERDGWNCVDCGDGTKTLHVHHRYYEWRLKPWEYEDDALTTLCEPCHERITAHTKLLKAALRRISPSDIIRVVGYVEALIACPDGEPIAITDAHMAVGVADYLGVSEKEIEDAMIAGGDDPVDICAFQLEGWERTHKRSVYDT